MAKDSKRKRKKTKQYSRKYMNHYINRNIASAYRKLKYMKATGSYKASEKAQEANSQLRMLYRKFGYDENTLHGSAKFRANLSSNQDMGVFFRAIKEIMEINTRVESRKYSKLKEQYSEKHIDFDDKFDMLSKLSSEFHEVYAFLSYEDISQSINDGSQDFGSIEDVLGYFVGYTRDKYLTEKEEEMSAKLNKKIAKNFNARQIKYIKEVSSTKPQGRVGIKTKRVGFKSQKGGKKL